MTNAALAGGHGTPATHLVYDGRTGELFGLWIKILLLTIITFGIYRFWGRTRIRKYLWNHTSLMGDRLEYDGTGGELFRRFLVAGVVLILLVLPTYIAQAAGLRLRLILGAQFVQLIIVIFLFFMALYAGRRYRFSRTLWRGMRGGVDGSAISYGLRSFGYALLGPLTLSLITPWQTVGLWRYEINHTGFGDWQAHFEGSGRKLLAPYLASFGIVAVGLIIAAVAMSGMFSALTSSNPGTATAILGVGAGLAAVIGACALPVSIAIGSLYFYTCATAYLVANTSFTRVTFSAELRKRDLFGLLFGNFLLMVFTFGLASPFVSQRFVRFFCRHLKIYHAEELLALTQAPSRRQKSGGEGLAQILDPGGFA